MSKGQCYACALVVTNGYTKRLGSLHRGKAMTTVPFVVAGGNCSGLPSRVCAEGVSARHINGRGSLTSVSQ